MPLVSDLIEYNLVSAHNALRENTTGEAELRESRIARRIVGRGKGGREARKNLGRREITGGSREDEGDTGRGKGGRGKGGREVIKEEFRKERDTGGIQGG